SVLLIEPCAQLIRQPSPVHVHVLQAGTHWGWLALPAALAAAVWHVGLTLARASVHVLCALGLGMGVLAACTASPLDQNDWVAFHTLLVGWAGVGAATLAVSWRIATVCSPRLCFGEEGSGVRGAEPALTDDVLPSLPTPLPSEGTRGEVAFPVALVRSWVV